MKVLVNVYGHWRKTWVENQLLFWMEAIGALTQMSGSLVLSLYAPNPNWILVYSLFFTGSFIMIWTSYQRESAWLLVMVSYYAVVNLMGFYNVL